MISWASLAQELNRRHGLLDKGNPNMVKFRQVIALAVVGLGLGLAVVGCGSPTTTGKDKMQGDKMQGDKMQGDKMQGGKMQSD